MVDIGKVPPSRNNSRPPCGIEIGALTFRSSRHCTTETDIYTDRHERKLGKVLVRHQRISPPAPLRDHGAEFFCKALLLTLPNWKPILFTSLVLRATVHAIEQVERERGCQGVDVVVISQKAIAWKAIRTVGIDDKITDLAAWCANSEAKSMCKRWTTASDVREVY